MSQDTRDMLTAMGLLGLGLIIGISIGLLTAP